MRILATQYSLSTKSFEIYTAGCNGNPHCEGCHNPESWDFNLGEFYDSILSGRIKEKIETFSQLIDNIMIFGGEPLDNPNYEVIELLEDLKVLEKLIWLFTGYEFKDVPKDILVHCNYIKCGRYERDKRENDKEQYGIKLASSNQKIYKKGLDY